MKGAVVFDPNFAFNFKWSFGFTDKDRALKAHGIILYHLYPLSASLSPVLHLSLSPTGLGRLISLNITPYHCQ